MLGLLQEENGVSCSMPLDRVNQPESLLYRISQSQHQTAVLNPRYCIKFLFVTGIRYVF